MVDGVTSGALGAVVSSANGVFTLSTASSPVLPDTSVALAFTCEPSFTLSAGIVTLPVVISTETSGLFEVH